MSALDDATGNVVSGTFRKIGEGFEELSTRTRRFVRDDLGFSQRVAQNTGDCVQIAAEVFTPGAAAKGVGAISRVSKLALKARFGENLSSVYSSKKAASAAISGASTSKNITSLEINNACVVSDEFVSYGLPWTSWNQYPKVVLDGKTYAKIGNRLYTEHAVGRMLPS